MKAALLSLLLATPALGQQVAADRQAPDQQAPDQQVPKTTYGAPQARVDVQIGKTPPIQADPLVRRGIYDRPYVLRLGSGSSDVAIGGYFDLVGSYLQQDGISEGFSAEARRFNLFITSKIADRLRLTSELEFEHGTEEIALETAALDVLLHHAVNLRGGILLVPIGKFNIAHDSPLYDIADRPLLATELLPLTWSDVGGGLFGALYPGGHKLIYEAYVINGLSNGLLSAQGTRLQDGKSPERFSKDENGQPAITARVGYSLPPRRRLQFEAAASFYSGLYNTPIEDGLTVDSPRWLHIMAFDTEASSGPITLRGEVAYARIDLPPALPDSFGSAQLGLYAEAIGVLLRRRLLLFERASLALVARVDYVDHNLGRRSTGEELGDEAIRLSVGASLRPAPGTALRLGYRHEWQRDLVGNLRRGGGFQISMASYF